jgi:hypothetical protein
MNQYIKIIASLSLFLGIAMALPQTARCAILFQNDDFATTESDSLVINSDDGASGNLTLQFGQSLGEYLRWNASSSLFELSDDLDLGSNQLMSARMENVAALPGGAGGLGAGGTGRIVQLTATDSTAPGCTLSPYCVAGTYTWNGTIWKNLESGGAPGGNANDVQYNTGSAFGGENAFEYDASNNQLTVPGFSLNEDFGLTGDISPAQLTADQDDWNPTGLSTATVIRVDGDSSFRSITGIAGGSDGRILRLVNVGTNAILLRDENTSSSSANRFDLSGYDISVFPSDTVTLQYDSTASRWRLLNEFPHIIPPERIGVYYYDDMADTDSYNAVSSQVDGTGAENDRTAVTGVAGHPSIIQHQTGTTTTGSAAIASVNNASILLGNGWYWRFEAMVRLSDGTNTYYYWAGFTDRTISSSTVDGCFLRYNHGIVSGQWQGICRSNSSESSTSGTTVVANTWYRLTILINPAGTEARFFVNGAQIGSTVTSNIPTGAGRGTGFGSVLSKTAGTTERVADLDYMEVIAYDNT